MGLLNILKGSEIRLSDQDIVDDMLKDSKFGITSLAKAVTEAANPQLKTILHSHLMAAVDEHHQLADLASRKDWYQPFMIPEQQLSNDLHRVQEMNH